MSCVMIYDRLRFVALIMAIILLYESYVSMLFVSTFLARIDSFSLSFLTFS